MLKEEIITHIFGFYLNSFSIKDKNNIHKEVHAYYETKVKLFECNHKKILSIVFNFSRRVCCMSLPKIFVACEKYLKKFP